MPKARVNGISIDYKIYGRGEPLVLIMGLGGTKSSWIFQVSAFKKYYKVITFDNRGVEKTDKPHRPFTIKTMADDTIGLMNYLGIDKTHILGASLGGMISQEIAINYPERVMKLILGCTTAGKWDTTAWGKTSGDFLELVRAMGFKEDFSDVDIGSLDFRSVDIKKIMSSITSLAFNKRSFRVTLVPLSKIYFKFAKINGLIEQLKATMTHDTLDRLHEIKAPTLVIVGTEDKLLPLCFSEVLADKIPNAKLVKIEGGSHSFFMEMSSRFNKEVLNFLKTG